MPRSSSTAAYPDSGNACASYAGSRVASLAGKARSRRIRAACPAAGLVDGHASAGWAWAADQCQTEFLPAYRSVCSSWACRAKAECQRAFRTAPSPAKLGPHSFTMHNIALQASEHTPAFYFKLKCACMGNALSDMFSNDVDGARSHSQFLRHGRRGRKSKNSCSRCQVPAEQHLSVSSVHARAAHAWPLTVPAWRCTHDVRLAVLASERCPWARRRWVRRRNDACRARRDGGVRKAPARTFQNILVRISEQRV